MKKIIKKGENGEPDVVVETDGELWNFRVGDVLRHTLQLPAYVRDDGNVNLNSYEVLGFRYGEQLLVQNRETKKIFYLESPRNLTLISHPGMKFKAGDQVKMISGVFAGETGKVAVIDPESPVCSFLVEFDFDGREGQTDAEASWDRPWFPKEHKLITRRKYFWASEGDMEGTMKRLIRAKDGREIEVETEGELWGFKTDDVVIDENDDGDKRLVAQGFRGNIIWVCEINSGYARPIVKPDGLLLVERDGLKFAVGDSVRITNGNGKDSIGTIAVIDPYDAAKELNNRPAHPYYVEIDFPDNSGYEAKRMENSWYPKKRKSNKERIMCGEHEIEKWYKEKEIASPSPRNDDKEEIASPTEGGLAMTEKKWPDSLEIGESTPEWLKEMALKIKANVSHFFILWGNIYDLQKVSDPNTRINANDANQKENTQEKRTDFIPLERCLIEVLGQAGKIPTMFYSISKGLYFDGATAEVKFRGRYVEKKAEKAPQKPAGQMSEGEKLAEDRKQTEKEMPLAEILGGKGPDKVFPFLEKFVLTEKSGPKILVIDFGHNVAPTETGTSDRHDRETIETLGYWARDKKIREAGGIIVLLTPHLVDVADGLRAPHSEAAAIRVPKPNEEERTS